MTFAQRFSETNNVTQSHACLLFVALMDLGTFVQPHLEVINDHRLFSVYIYDGGQIPWSGRELVNVC